MKVYISLIVPLLMAYSCLAFQTSTKSLATKSNLDNVVKLIAKDIKYDINSRSITISSLTSLLDSVKVKLKDLGTWISSKENSNTFIGRCLGVARGIRVAMPLIMVKLGVIVTILIFLTIFSLKTLALLLFSTLFSASHVAGKFAFWKQPQHQRPQNIHLHIYQSRKNLQGHLYPHTEDRNSLENFSTYVVENDQAFTEKPENLNLLSSFQQGFYQAYSTQPSIDLNLDSRIDEINP